MRGGRNSDTGQLGAMSASIWKERLCLTLAFQVRTDPHLRGMGRERLSLRLAWREGGWEEQGAGRGGVKSFSLFPQDLTAVNTRALGTGCGQISFSGLMRKTYSRAELEEIHFAQKGRVWENDWR